MTMQGEGEQPLLKLAESGGVTRVVKWGLNVLVGVEQLLCDRVVGRGCCLDHLVFLMLFRHELASGRVACAPKPQSPFFSVSFHTRDGHRNRALARSSQVNLHVVNPSARDFGVEAPPPQRDYCGCFSVHRFFIALSTQQQVRLAFSWYCETEIFDHRDDRVPKVSSDVRAVS